MSKKTRQILSSYDEHPVHQTPYTFAHVPSTDFSWDDGCYFGIFNPEEKLFLCVGYRVNPNTDMIGGFALLNVAGQQHTVRFSRCWRRDMRTVVGPFSVEVIEPLRKLRLRLAPNEGGLTFDIAWDASSPAIVEEHHLAENRGRRTTDQTRYSQAGAPTGFIEHGGKRWTVEPKGWNAARDHSWGLYAERRPLSPDPRWLPPKLKAEHTRALRFWIIFRSAPFSGFFHLHEDSNGVQRDFSDVFGTALGGAIFDGWDKEHEIASAKHEAEYEQGTRILKRALITIHDTDGGKWVLEFSVAAPPWIAQTSGYMPGGWKDGGNVHTYHGSEELALEWDSFDFSKQPVVHKPYRTESGFIDEFGTGLAHEDTPIQGVVYLCALRTTSPDGRTHTGAAHVEHWIAPPYHPYGFK
jgi:hypothetical protein